MDIEKLGDEVDVLIIGNMISILFSISYNTPNPIEQSNQAGSSDVLW